MSPIRDPKFVLLIGMVQQNKALYDDRLLKYHDKEHKNKIWAKVAENCGFENAEKAKNTWNELYKSFMICYRNELVWLARRSSKENGIQLSQDKISVLKATWGYFSDMSFVAPYCRKNDPELAKLAQLVKPDDLDTSRQQTNSSILISNVRASAETQTPAESVLMDIPPIVEENLSEQEMCLRSFFDAMFRATNALPVRMQSKIKRDLLQSVNDAEIEAESEKYNGWVAVLSDIVSSVKK